MTILARTPSSTASTSIVALSVSISASTSPARTDSPSLLSQRAILPSVIVGDKAGIRTSIDMAQRNLLRAGSPNGSGVSQYIRPQLGGIGFRAILRELRRCSDAIPDLGFDLLERRLRRSAFDKPTARLIDRIVLGAHSVDLLSGTVLCRVGHRMAAITVGHHFENDRPLTRASVLGGGEAGFVDSQNIHAVNLFALNAMGGAPM